MSKIAKQTPVVATKSTAVAAEKPAREKKSRQQKCVARITRAAGMLNKMPCGKETRALVLAHALDALDTLKGVVLGMTDADFAGARAHGGGKEKVEIAAGTICTVREKYATKYPGVNATTALKVISVDGKYLIIARPDEVRMLMPRNHVAITPAEAPAATLVAIAATPGLALADEGDELSL